MKFKGALGPGQMLAVDMKKGKLFRDTEIKDKLARRCPLANGSARSTSWMTSWRL